MRLMRRDGVAILMISMINWPKRMENQKSCTTVWKVAFL